MSSHDEADRIVPQQLIERAAVASWPALETLDVDGWLWRCSSGGSLRGNSVSALEFRGTSVDAAIDRIETLYAAKGVASVFTITGVDAPDDLDGLLAVRGYTRGEDHVTMIKTVDPDATLPGGVAVGVQPTLGWMQAYLSGLNPNRRSAAPRLIANLPPLAVFVGDETDGVATSSGLTICDRITTVEGDVTVASVQCMATRADARRRGGAQRVLAAIEAVAAQNDVGVLYLQTSADNAPARRLYEGAGFSVLSHYHIRSKPIV